MEKISLFKALPLLIREQRRQYKEGIVVVGRKRRMEGGIWRANAHRRAVECELRSEAEEKGGGRKEARDSLSSSSFILLLFSPLP